MLDKRYRTVMKGPLGDAKPAAVFLSQMASCLEPYLDLAGVEGEPELTLEAIDEAKAVPPEAGHWWAYLPDGAPPFTGEWLDSLTSFADRLFVAHPVLRDRLVAAGLERERVTVLYPGIDPTVFTPEGPVTTLTDKAFRIVYWGAVDWVSGLDALLKAYKEAFVAGESVALIVADPQSEEGLDRLEALQKELDWENGPLVQYLPVDDWVSTDRAELFRGCDLLVCPQRLVGHSQSLREAMSCGMAALVPDRPTGLLAGSPTRFLVKEETRVQGDQGLVWHEPHVGAIAHHLRTFFNRGKATREQAMLVCEEVRLAHSWNLVAAELLSHVQELGDPPRHVRLTQRLGFLEAGMNALEGADFVKAEASFQEALASDVSDEDALLGMAFAAFNLKKWKSCIDHLIPYVRQMPYEAKGFHLLGVALFNMGEKVAAKKAFQRVVEIDPRHDAAKRSLKKLATVQGELLAIYSDLFDGVAIQGQKRRPTISLCMITKNEEAFLGQCLLSVRGAVDEIVIVDTGSTDRTIEIAQEFGAKVFHFPWTGDFSEARNHSLSHATGDWILVLDADEVLEPESIPLLHQVVEKRTEKIPIYLLRIINLVGKEGKGEVEHFMVRLFPNHPDVRFRGRIHEQAGHAREELVERSALSDVRLRHYGYKTDTIAERGKEARNLALLEQAIEEDPDNTFHHFNQGMTLRMAGRSIESQASLFRSMDLAFLQNIKPVFLATAHVYIIGNFIDLQRPVEAVAHGSKVRDVCHEHADYWISMGLAFFMLNRYAEAITMYEQAIELGKRPSIHLVDSASYTWRPRLGIANARKGLGQIDEARKELVALLDLHPDPSHVRLLLAQLEFEQQRFEQSEQHLRWILLHYSEGQAWDTAWPIWMRLAEQCDAEEGLKILRRLPANPEVLCAWSLTAIQQGQFEEAMEASTKWILLASTAEAFQVRSEAFLQLGRLEEAEADLKTALDLAPKADLWCNLGLVAMRRGDYPAAKVAFDQALALDAEHPPTLVNLAQMAYSQGQTDEAEGYLEDLLVSDPDNLEGFTMRASFAMEQGRLDEADKWLAPVLDRHPGHPRALIQMGFLRLDQERYPEALDYFGRSLQEGSQSSELYRGLGIALLNTQSFEDAEHAFRLALNQDPEDAMSQRGLQVAEGLKASSVSS